MTAKQKRKNLIIITITRKIGLNHMESISTGKGVAVRQVTVVWTHGSLFLLKMVRIVHNDNDNDNRNNKSFNLFTLSSICSTNASGSEQIPETNNLNQTLSLLQHSLSRSTSLPSHHTHQNILCLWKDGDHLSHTRCHDCILRRASAPLF